MRLPTLLVIVLISSLGAPSPTPQLSENRVKRWMSIVTYHAEQVKERFADYFAEQKRLEDAEETKKRVKREWFATMTPEQVRDRLTLHSMVIKKKHH